MSTIYRHSEKKVNTTMFVCLLTMWSDAVSVSLISYSTHNVCHEQCQIWGFTSRRYQITEIYPPNIAIPNHAHLIFPSLSTATTFPNSISLSFPLTRSDTLRWRGRRRIECLPHPPITCEISEPGHSERGYCVPLMRNALASLLKEKASFGQEFGGISRSVGKG